MSIKLIATDMDGTLLNSKKELPADFEQWVINNPDKRVVIASGRQFYTLRRDLGFLEKHLIFIAENGGVVFDDGQIIYYNEMDSEYVRACFEIFDRNPVIRPVICGLNSAYMINPTDEDMANAGIYYANLKVVNKLEEALRSDTIVKLAIYVADQKADEKLVLFEGLKDRIDVVLSGVKWIDFANYSANKGNALKAIMERYGIDRSETMAFGDYLNDYSLLESCEESYCMANGHPKLKAIAKYIARSNDEDGVMDVLRGLK